MTMMRLVSMPMSCAVSGSWAVACMARPVRLLRTKKARADMHTMAATTRKMSASLMVTEPMSWVVSRPGKARARSASG